MNFQENLIKRFFNDSKDLTRLEEIILKKLEIIDFSRNQIVEIQEEHFNGLNNLQTLDLSYNDLVEISEITFNDLKNLMNLN